MIISNNKLVVNKFENVISVDGLFRDVLIQARDLVYLGHKLETHPLFASIGMMHSPTRSIILSDERVYDELSLTTISQSIEKYERTMGIRNVKEKQTEDFELIDLQLLEAALNELEMIEKGDVHEIRISKN